MLAHFSPIRIRRLPNMDRFLEDDLCYNPRGWNADIKAVLTWGRKTEAREKRYAQRHGLPLWQVEEGFLRSVGLGVHYVPPLSVILDRTGIYYDATMPSDLETLLETPGWESPALLAQADEAIRAIVDNDLSKFNQGTPAPPGTLARGDKGAKKDRPAILLIDQTYNDRSISLGLATPGSFQDMLAAARRDHPDGDIFIKTHPNVIARMGKGHFSPEDLRGVTLLGGDHSPLSLLAQADEVYAVSSQMGFEALLLGKPVHCFGMPFYAGWGLTRDALRCARRTRRRSLTEVFAAAYMLYARYVNPVSRQRVSILDAIRLLATQKACNDRNRGRLACLAFSRDERNCLAPYLASTHNELRFFQAEDRAEQWAAPDGRLVAWAGSGAKDGQPRILVREAFLGPRPALWTRPGSPKPPQPAAHAGRPYSLAFETRDSLEGLLAAFDVQALPGLLDRAAALRRTLARTGLHRYPEGRRDIPVIFPEGRRRVLVHGRSPYGMPEGLDDAGLLRAASQKHGQDRLDFLVYKAHPDVEFHGARGDLGREEALELADGVADEAWLGSLLAQAEAVHVVDSLAGFEALLRGLEVHVHGRPWYAGWGLTKDRQDLRRPRRLSLDELVAVALIVYPRYYDWESGHICTPEDLVHRMEHPGKAAPGKTDLRMLLWEAYRRIGLKIRFG